MVLSDFLIYVSDKFVFTKDGLIYFYPLSM